MLFDVGRASGTKLCRLLWNTNLVEIELSSLCLPWSSVKRQHWQGFIQDFWLGGGNLLVHLSAEM